MSSGSIRKMLRAQPFQPFEVRLANGEVIHVTDPEWALLSPRGRTFIVYERGGGEEDFQMIDSRLITTIEPIRERGNGRKRRRRAG